MMDRPFVVVATGSRNWSDGDYVEGVFRAMKEDHRDMVVHVGDARGADAIVRQLCSKMSIPCTVHVADWKKRGRAAGPVRNRAMLDAAKPDLVVAFLLPGSRGTIDCMAAARQRSIAVEVFHGD